MIELKARVEELEGYCQHRLHMAINNYKERDELRTQLEGESAALKAMTIHFRKWGLPAKRARGTPPPPPIDGNLETFDALERRFIEEAFERHGRHVLHTAIELGMSDSTLRRRLKTHGISLNKEIV